MLISKPNLVSYFILQYIVKNIVENRMKTSISYTLHSLNEDVTKSNAVEFLIVMIALPRSNIYFMRQTSFLTNVYFKRSSMYYATVSYENEVLCLINTS